MFVALVAAAASGASLPDTVRLEGGRSYVVSRQAVLALEGDSVVARLPWSSPLGLAPVAACEGPDRGLVVVDASRGGRVVHLSPTLRAVSLHPLPGALRASDLPGARATWRAGRGLVLQTARPPRRWLLGYLNQAPRELPLTDSGTGLAP